jgi:hypothetical protein
MKWGHSSSAKLYNLPVAHHVNGSDVNLFSHYTGVHVVLKFMSTFQTSDVVDLPFAFLPSERATVLVVTVGERPEKTRAYGGQQTNSETQLLFVHALYGLSLL